MDLRSKGNDSPEFQMAPLIDCVFLLLIYFMCATSLQQMESELNVGLPAVATERVIEKLPLEIAIVVTTGGNISVNNMEYDSPDSKDLPQLTAMLLKVTTDLHDQSAYVTIRGDKETNHERIVDVLNACASAKIQNVAFPVQ